MDNDATAAGYLLMAAFRIGVTIYCANRADKLNRSGLGWGVLGFVFPIIALIAIHLVKARTVWEHDPSIERIE